MNVTDEHFVLFSLSTNSPGSISHPERRIILTPSRPTLKIGRSSTRPTLGLVPDISNGWFDSPVMSRSHAEIEADLHTQAIEIRDLHSMHGTFVNKERVDTERRTLLATGDKITFGVPVYRNQRTFQPATITVGMEFHNGPRAENSPSRVFTVPDDCSTDDSEPVDDTIFPGFGHAPRLERRSPINRCQPEGVIEIDSDSDSDSMEHHDAISISTRGNKDMNCEGPDYPSLDEESVSLTDDERTSSAPTNPIDSGNPEHAVHIDNLRSPSASWKSVSTDLDSDHVNEDRLGYHKSEGGQGMVMDKIASKKLDDVESTEYGFIPSAQPSSRQSGLISASTPPVLPSISTAVFSPAYDPAVMPYSLHLAPVNRPDQRQPSPSDAVLPRSHRGREPEDGGSVTVESLGRKSGKLEFFQAREGNKVVFSQLTKQGITTSPEADAAAAVTTEIWPRNEASDARVLASDSTEDFASSSSAIGKSSNCIPTRDKSPVPENATSRPNCSAQISQDPVKCPDDRKAEVMESVNMPTLLGSEQTFLNTPAKNNAVESPSEAIDLDWAAASAFRLFQIRRQFEAKQLDLKSGRKSIGCATDDDNSKESQVQISGLKRKRKATEISEASEQEMAWDDQVQRIAPSLSVHHKPAIVSYPEAEVALPLPPHSPEQRNVETRPAKFAKIAERLGFAALGGATVGAMVLTSLIYTAPTFS